MATPTPPPNEVVWVFWLHSASHLVSAPKYSVREPSALADTRHDQNNAIDIQTSTSYVPTRSADKRIHLTEIQFFTDSHTDVGRRNATGVKAMVHCADAAAKTDTNAKLDFRRDDDWWEVVDDWWEVCIVSKLSSSRPMTMGLIIKAEDLWGMESFFWLEMMNQSIAVLRWLPANHHKHSRLEFLCESSKDRKIRWLEFD